MTEQVILSVEGPVATIRLNRPEVGNSIDMGSAQALLKASIQCDQDPAIRCVILTGTGRLFCAGGDLETFRAAGDQVPGLLSELAGILHLAISRLQRMGKPLVVLVNGPAAGAGLSLAISGDIVLSARSAHFTAAYSAVGLSPDGGLTWNLPRLIGLRKAQEMVVLNKRVPSQQAEDIGLITRAVDDDKLLAEGIELAETLARSATGALGGTRRLLLETYEDGLEAHLEKEARSIAALSAGLEAREGISAFVGKRKPIFYRGVENG
ncbi:enoyl-CoA hydratase/isomerase family protein [Cupriavidus necator]|uniref:enoyl-CoA hydratase/isomerase family protein n=1 Tax=Cupriavidus necator TaxID=106590 RepID=UPI00059B54CA|nr:enoyl-CoA hydratase-related protein [Cupriavidus necator]MDX6008745.1 enoyl-CoA hydratase-related protein [Cupriavidus necator]